MLVNIAEQIRTWNPGVSVYLNQWPADPPGPGDHPDSGILIRDIGGAFDVSTRRRDHRFQVLSRALSSPMAAELLSLWVARRLSYTFGREFPAATVGGRTYPALKTSRVLLDGIPGYIGRDDEMRHEYSANYIFTPSGVDWPTIT